MRNTSRTATDTELMERVGQRLRTLRLAQPGPPSIIHVAAAAGLDRDTVSSAEMGRNPTLLTLVRLLRVYGRLDVLELFIPEPEVSPMAAVRERKREARDG